MNQASPFTRKSECLSHCSNSHTVKHVVLNRQKEEGRKLNKQGDVGGCQSINDGPGLRLDFLKLTCLAVHAYYILQRLMLYNGTICLYL